MNPTEKLMNGLLPAITMIITAIACYAVYKYFERKGSYPLFKTQATILVAIFILYFAGRALGLS